MIPYIFFLLTFLFIVNWFQFLAFASAVFGSKVRKEEIKDKWIYEIVLKKTGLKLTRIIVFHDKKMYGMMAGLPFWPKMILSEGLYKALSRNELEWVVLHEAGHCVLWHNLKAFIIELVFLILGLIFIYLYKLNFIVSFFLTVVFSLVCIQVIRWVIEYQADKYAITKVDDPKSVITAQEKFRKAESKNMFSSEKSIGRFLLHWNIYPAKRIEMAKSRLSNG